MPVVLGVGVDIIEISRIRELMERKGESLSRKVFTEAELSSVQGRWERLAARFAAKEAVSKALGTGIRGMRWCDIELQEDELGRPIVRLHGGALRVAEEKGICEVFVSMSHSLEYAVAFAVACGGGRVETGDCRGNEGD